MAEKFSPHAKVVDGILILSLPDAVSPVVWQMEIGQAKSSAMEVRPADNDNEFSLVLKTPRADVLEIARYQKKEDAVRALMSISSAMEKAQGQFRAYGDIPASERSRGMPYDYSVPAIRSGHSDDSKIKTYVYKPLAYVSSALVLFVILFLITSSMIRMFVGIDTSSSATSSASSSTVSQPMNAEDFLEGR